MRGSSTADYTTDRDVPGRSSPPRVAENQMLHSQRRLSTGEARRPAKAAGRMPPGRGPKVPRPGHAVEGAQRGAGLLCLAALVAPDGAALSIHLHLLHGLFARVSRLSGSWRYYVVYGGSRDTGCGASRPAAQPVALHSSAALQGRPRKSREALASRPSAVLCLYSRRPFALSPRKRPCENHCAQRQRNQVAPLYYCF